MGDEKGKEGRGKREERKEIKKKKRKMKQTNQILGIFLFCMCSCHRTGDNAIITINMQYVQRDDKEKKEKGKIIKILTSLRLRKYF